jgi:hypothetical protein
MELSAPKMGGVRQELRLAVRVIHSRASTPQAPHPHWLAIVRPRTTSGVFIFCFAFPLAPDCATASCSGAKKGSPTFDEP